MYVLDVLVKQIVDNNYFARLEYLGYLKFQGYGISFFDKMCVIKRVEMS